MVKVKLTELYKIKEGNIIDNPELNVSGSLTRSAGNHDMNNTNSIGPSGPASIG